MASNIIIKQCEYAPNGSKPFIRKGMKGWAVKVFETTYFYVPLKGTASRTDYSGGLTLEQRQCIANEGKLTLNSETRLYTCGGSKTSHFTLPAGTVLLRIAGGCAAVAATLWYRLPGVEYAS